MIFFGIKIFLWFALISLCSGTYIEDIRQDKREFIHGNFEDSTIELDNFETIDFGSSTEVETGTETIAAEPIFSSGHDADDVKVDEEFIENVDYLDSIIIDNGKSIVNNVGESVLAKNAENRIDFLFSLSDAIAGGGIPGEDYPILASVPETGFECASLQGYYADISDEARCQVFHICQEDGRHDAFLCPNGTLFNQKYLVCDWWFNVDCNNSDQFFELNATNIDEANEYNDNNTDLASHEPQTLYQKPSRF